MTTLSIKESDLGDLNGKVALVTGTNPFVL
jgi:hypothetical protein